MPAPGRRRLPGGQRSTRNRPARRYRHDGGTSRDDSRPTRRPPPARTIPPVVSAADRAPGDASPTAAPPGRRPRVGALAVAARDDIAALEHRRNRHRGLARRYLERAESAATAGDRAAADRWAETARRFEALASEDDHKLHALHDRQRNALTQAVANRLVLAPDLTR